MRPASVSSSALKSAMACALACCAAGCVVSAGEPPTPIPVDAGQSDKPYPPGPYGVSVGQVIRDYSFTGYARPGEGIGAARRGPITLSDFYNPTGHATYAEGSPFGAGTARPKALVVNVSAVWCVSCKLEAQSVLPEEYAELHPRGAELLFDLAESAEPGNVASFTELDSWISKFAVTYPAVVDPSYQLGSVFPSSSFPANMLVNTRDMTIVDLVSGVPEESFWTKVNGLLEAP
jgi:hypothetical protein